MGKLSSADMKESGGMMKNFYAFMIFFALLLIDNPDGASAKQPDPVMLKWEKVNGILPKYSIFTVEDVETGKKFKVQRRAGSRHADVQPLNADETKVMKEIYNGKWSWKRRAIIVIGKDRRIAASMHGMPHGAGALKNKFPGHFCIHFYGSTTHRTGSMDLSHKLMVLKAAGKVDEYLENANPYELVDSFFAGMKQKDLKIVSLLSLKETDLQSRMASIDNVALNRMSVLPFEDMEGELSLSVPAESVFILGDGRFIKFNGEIQLVRFTPFAPWKIDTDDFFEKLALPSPKKSKAGHF
ncbi:hypothetical protein [Mesobacillus zeae]|uniref:hypothetical protein n=1 Tax=Mesobacillus zeae TaxID=1917180 RepID=UPI0015E7656D|nr:hypothetical protein [Mesobacillus zeae]